MKIMLYLTKQAKLIYLLWNKKGKDMININNKEWDKLRFSDIQKHLSEDDDENFFFEYKNDEVKSKHLINDVGLSLHGLTTSTIIHRHAPG